MIAAMVSFSRLISSIQKSYTICTVTIRFLLKNINVTANIVSDYAKEIQQKFNLLVVDAHKLIGTLSTKKGKVCNALQKPSFIALPRPEIDRNIPCFEI